MEQLFRRPSLLEIPPGSGDVTHPGDLGGLQRSLLFDLLSENERMEVVESRSVPRMSFGGLSVVDCFLHRKVFDFNRIIVCTYGYSWWPNQ